MNQITYPHHFEAFTKVDWLNYTEEHSWKEMPKPPGIYVDFMRSSNMDKLRTQSVFWSRQEIQEYLELKWKAQEFNRDAFYWLWELANGKWGIFETMDEDVKERINTKLLKIKTNMLSQKDWFKALKIRFENYPIKETVLNWEE